MRIYRDMVVIREFETMLHARQDDRRTTTASSTTTRAPPTCRPVRKPPAVGMAYMLDIDDFIFGSHRSHGEILAKGLRCDRACWPTKSLDEDHGTSSWDGATVNVAKKAFEGGDDQGAGYPLPALRRRWPRSSPATTGFQQGSWAAPCTRSSLPFGIYPNNAIVGGSAQRSPRALRCIRRVNRQEGRRRLPTSATRPSACGPVYEGHELRRHGPVQDTCGRTSCKGGLPSHLQRLGQPVRHGRPDHGRDHGPTTMPGPSRRRHHPEPDARRACRRLQSAGCHRLLQAARKRSSMKKKDGPVLLDVRDLPL